MRRLASVALGVVMCVSVLPADTAPMSAMLSTTGLVRINGSDAPRTTAVFRGDAIATQASATVTLTVPGSLVLVPANSTVVFKGDVIDVSSGSALVSTTKGMRTHADTYDIAPAQNGNGRFQVVRQGSFVQVRAERGALAITAADGTHIVPEGSVENLGEPSSDKKTATSEDELSPPPVAKRSRSSRRAIWIGALGAGGGAAGAALFIGRPHASPVVP